MEATARVDILAALARRYRDEYGDRLVELYALPRNFAETDGVVEVAMEVEREYDFEYGIFPHHASEDDDFAQVAREDGVRL